MTNWHDEDLTTAQARKLAKANGIKLPKVGYEVSLGNGLWLSSTGHHQFGWFGRPQCKAPFRLYGRV